MSLSPPAPAPADPPDLSDLGADDQPARRRRRWGTWAAVAISLAIVGMWVYVYAYGAVHKPVDKLDSPAFGRRAEPVCAVTLAQLNALPKAFQSTNNVDRAEVVTQTNQDLRDMLANLAKVAPTTGNDAHIVREWLGDYSTYVGNRENYATRLRTDPGARFYESELDGDQISDPIDSFATANGMGDCVAPEDLS
jgi:hypothetical protein